MIKSDLHNVEIEFKYKMLNKSIFMQKLKLSPNTFKQIYSTYVLLALDSKLPVSKRYLYLSTECLI